MSREAHGNHVGSQSVCEDRSISGIGAAILRLRPDNGVSGHDQIVEELPTTRELAICQVNLACDVEKTVSGLSESHCRFDSSRAAHSTKTGAMRENSFAAKPLGILPKGWLRGGWI